MAGDGRGASGRGRKQPSGKADAAPARAAGGAEAGARARTGTGTKTGRNEKGKRLGEGDGEGTRCTWAKTALSIAYHDGEWGVPQREPRALFELLILEGAQAGLSWETILAKRENYRVALDGFDPARIARYDAKKIRALLANSGIVRNRLKIAATISNARAWLQLEETTDPVDFLWSFVCGEPKLNRRRRTQDIPPRTRESDAMSDALKARGFRFVGTTICYAFMQATGMVNDHLVSCPRHAACVPRARA